MQDTSERVFVVCGGKKIPILKKFRRYRFKKSKTDFRITPVEDIPVDIKTFDQWEEVRDEFRGDTEVAG